MHENSRIRLLKLIENIPGVILLTGDIHYGELIKNPCLKYPLYEITASGLSHTELTTYGPIIYPYFYIYVQSSYNVFPRVQDKHFGTLEIDWDLRTIEISIKDTDNRILYVHRLGIDELYTETQKSYVCDQSPYERHIFQFLAGIVVFVFPVTINLGILVMFFRKYSNSY